MFSHSLIFSNNVGNSFNRGTTKRAIKENIKIEKILKNFTDAVKQYAN